MLSFYTGLLDIRYSLSTIIITHDSIIGLSDFPALTYNTHDSHCTTPSELLRITTHCIFYMSIINQKHNTYKTQPLVIYYHQLMS